MGLLDDAIREHLELKRRRGADAGDLSRQESEALGPVQRGPDGAPDLPATFTPPDEAVAEEPAAPAGWDAQTQAYSPPAPPGYEPPATIEPEPPPAPAAYEPPPVTPAYEPPPAPAAYEPPAPAKAAYGLPPTSAYEPPTPSPYEPAPTAADEPPAQPAHEPPTYERPPLVYGTPSGTSEPEPDPEPEPEPEQEADRESHSLFSRLRVGRKSTRPSEPDPPRRADEPAAYEPSPGEPDADVEDVLEETPDFLEETPEHDRLWFEQRPPRDFDFDDK